MGPRRRPTPHTNAINRGAVVIAGAVAIVLGLALWLAVALWPAVTAAIGADRLELAGKASDAAAVVIPRVHWLGLSNFVPDRTNAPLILALAFGTVGASINTAWNLSIHIANGRARTSWFTWNALSPIFGAALALLVHLTFSAKLFGVGYDDATLRPATIAVMSGAAGLSSTKIRTWLQQGLTNQLAGRRRDSSPVITELVPAKVAAGQGAKVRIVGSNLTEATTVVVGEVAHSPTMNGDDLEVDLPAGELATAGTLGVVAKNNAGQSDPIDLTVEP